MRPLTLLIATALALISNPGLAQKPAAPKVETATEPPAQPSGAEDPAAASEMATETHADSQAPEGPPPGETQTITLDQAQQLCLTNNANMRNVDEQVYEADLLIYRAWAILAPSLTLSGSIIRNSDEVKLDFSEMMQGMPLPPGTDTGEPIVIQELWAKSYGLSARMALFNPRSIPLIKNADDYQEMIHIAAKHQKNEMLFAVTSAYYQVNSTQELILVSEDNLKIAEQFLRLAEATKKVQTGTKIDVLRAEIQVMDAQKRLDDAKEAHRLAKSALGYLAGIRGAFEIAPPAAANPATGDVTGLQQNALENRADLASSRIAEQIAVRDRKETWTKFLPSFDVTYNWNWTSAEGFAGQQDTWMLIFGASWKLFDGGNRLVELKERASKIRTAHNNTEQLIVNINQEVENAIAAVQKSRRNLALAEKQVALAAENHHLVRRQFEVGLATSLDLATASTELAAKRNTQVVEQLMFEINTLALNKSLGDYHALAGEVTDWSDR